MVSVLGLLGVLACGPPYSAMKAEGTDRMSALEDRVRELERSSARRAGWQVLVTVVSPLVALMSAGFAWRQYRLRIHDREVDRLKYELCERARDEARSKLSEGGRVPLRVTLMIDDVREQEAARALDAGRFGGVQEVRIRSHRGHTVADILIDPMIETYEI